jgi:enoyl-CoA hydratase/carnithine racemase
MSYSIEVSQAGEHISQVTFTDAARENQLCWAAVDELARVLESCRAGGNRVIVLCSGLEGHWLEHAWLQDLSDGIEGKEQTGQGTGWFKVQQELTHEDIISIAAISGDSSGGGAELGWACDLRIAERQARFSQPEINMSLTTGIGGCTRLSRLAGRATAAEMVYTGKPVSAERLYQLGAINQVAEAGTAVAEAMQTAERLSQKSPIALSGLKRILNEGADMPLPSALELEQGVFQSTVVSDAARTDMSRIQANYNRGATIASVNGYSTWKDDGAENAADE